MIDSEVIEAVRSIPDGGRTLEEHLIVALADELHSLEEQLHSADAALEAMGGQLETFQRERDENLGSALYWSKKHRELEEQLEATREALSLCGDLLFGTWDDDIEKRTASRKAEALTRAVLYPASEPKGGRVSEFSTEHRPTERQFERDGQRIAELEKALDDSCDVAIWLSGLDCLRTNEEAWRTWEDSMRPKLFKALDSRASNQDRDPATMYRERPDGTDAFPAFVRCDDCAWDLCDQAKVCRKTTYPASEPKEGA